MQRSVTRSQRVNEQSTRLKIYNRAAFHTQDRIFLSFIQLHSTSTAFGSVGTARLDQAKTRLVSSIQIHLCSNVVQKTINSITVVKTDWLALNRRK